MACIAQQNRLGIVLGFVGDEFACAERQPKLLHKRAVGFGIENGNAFRGEVVAHATIALNELYAKISVGFSKELLHEICNPVSAS